MNLETFDLAIILINILTVLLLALIYLHSYVTQKAREKKIAQYQLQPFMPTSQIDKYKISKKQKSKTSKGKQKDEYQCELCSFTFTLDSTDQ